MFLNNWETDEEDIPFDTLMWRPDDAKTCKTTVGVGAMSFVIWSTGKTAFICLTC